jgi:putative membrane protein
VSYVIEHWSLDPFLIVAIVLAVWHEAGLARLARRSRPERTRQRRRRSLWFYGGLAVLLIAVLSPIDYWADDYFFVHMIQHLLLMFAAPMMIVAGAPWQPLLDGLPAGLGRRVTHGVLAGPWWRPLRMAGAAALRPWVAVVIFNVVMLAWHLPVLFDLAERNQAVHIWLMHGSFFGAGVLFWLQFIGSPPFRIRMPPAAQAAALLLTNVVMWILAMALGIFSSSSWYPVYSHLRGITLPPFADQQIGAGILWVCGDFWAVPVMIGVIRRLIDTSGDLSSAADRIFGRGSGRAGWAGRRSGDPVPQPGRDYRTRP